MKQNVFYILISESKIDIIIYFKKYVYSYKLLSNLLYKYLNITLKKNSPNCKYFVFCNNMYTNIL